MKQMNLIFKLFILIFCISSVGFACDESEKTPTENPVVEPTSEEIKYVVTFDVDGVLESTEVKDGEKAEKPLDPFKDGFRFLGWYVGDALYDFNSVVTSNVTLVAKFEEQTPVLVKYVVTFDVDGVLETTEVKEGEKIGKPLDPVKDGFKFLGWYVGDALYDFDSPVTADVTLSAKFEIACYAVTFIDSDGKEISKSLVEHGKAAVAPEIEASLGMQISWDKDFSNVTSDLTVQIIYSFKKYLVTFITEDGVVLSEIEVEYGKAATEPNYDALEEYEYFWDLDFDYITEDITITLYKEIKVFTVKFVDNNGKVIKTEKVEYGKAATAPSYDENLFIANYDMEFNMITSDLTITCTYNKTSGEILYYDGNNKLDLNPSSYKIGEETILPTPEKAGYEFIGWFLSDISLTKYTKIDSDSTIDYKFYARFVETEKQDLIKLPDADYHFDTIKSVLHSSGTFYVYQPQMPAGAPSGVANYNWTTSDSSIAKVSAWSTITIASNGYCVLTATHKTEPIVINCLMKTTSDGVFVSSEEEANLLEVINVFFKGKNGELIEETVCSKGGSVIYPKPIKYDGYKFVGWDKENYNIKEDTVITALYEEGVNNYEGKSFAIIGDSISTYQQYIPNGFASFYPYPTADVIDVNLTWWMRVINKLGSSLFVNNSYSGTCVADGSSNATKNMSRLEHCVINGETPDVILVFMGANDCASKYVTSTAFNQGYTLMLNNLKKLCPNSEIILCTLPQTKYYSNSSQEEFNAVIREHAEKFELKLVDCSPVSIAEHLVDSAHPDSAGMKVVADQMIKELLK